MQWYKNVLLFFSRIVTLNFKTEFFQLKTKNYNHGSRNKTDCKCNIIS